ncbi:MAG: glycosyltransferase [Gemmobacter sp.]
MSLSNPHSAAARLITSAPSTLGRILYKHTLGRMRYARGDSYDAEAYWGDRFRKFGPSLKGPGHEGLNEDDNRAMYDAAGTLFADYCAREGVRFAGRRVLEIGCGTGFYTDLIARLGPPATFTGLDVTDANFAAIGTRHPAARLVKGDAAARTGAAPAVSGPLARAFEGLTGIRPDIIPMGVDVSRFHPADRAAAAETGPRILSVGRLAAKKGLHHLLDALALVAPDLPGVQLTIVGDGPVRPALEAQAVRLGIADRVCFLGMLPNDTLPALFAAADLFVVPSIMDETGDREGLPVSILEAAASSVPVVASDVGGISDFVEDAVTGLLVPPGDAAVLARAIGRLARDAGLARTMVVTARAGRGRVFLGQRVGPVRCDLPQVAGGMTPLRARYAVVGTGAAALGVLDALLMHGGDDAAITVFDIGDLPAPEPAAGTGAGPFYDAVYADLRASGLRGFPPPKTHFGARLPVHPAGHGLVQSRSFGGLTNFWGATMLPFTGVELQN